MQHSSDLICWSVWLVFCRKDLCEARPKMESVFKFLDVLFALSQMDSPIDETSDQVDIFDRSLGQAELWSDGLIDLDN